MTIHADHSSPHPVTGLGIERTITAPGVGEVSKISLTDDKISQLTNRFQESTVQEVTLHIQLEASQMPATIESPTVKVAAKVNGIPKAPVFIPTAKKTTNDPIAAAKTEIKNIDQNLKEINLKLNNAMTKERNDAEIELLRNSYNAEQGKLIAAEKNLDVLMKRTPGETRAKRELQQAKNELNDKKWEIKQFEANSTNDTNNEKLTTLRNQEQQLQANLLEKIGNMDQIMSQAVAKAEADVTKITKEGIELKGGIIDALENLADQVAQLAILEKILHEANADFEATKTPSETAQKKLAAAFENFDNQQVEVENAKEKLKNAESQLTPDEKRLYEAQKLVEKKQDLQEQLKEINKGYKLETLETALETKKTAQNKLRTEAFTRVSEIKTGEAKLEEKKNLKEGGDKDKATAEEVETQKSRSFAMEATLKGGFQPISQKSQIEKGQESTPTPSLSGAPASMETPESLAASSSNQQSSAKSTTSFSAKPNVLGESTIGMGKSKTAAREDQTGIQPQPISSAAAFKASGINVQVDVTGKTMTIPANATIQSLNSLQKQVKDQQELAKAELIKMTGSNTVDEIVNIPTKNIEQFKQIAAGLGNTPENISKLRELIEKWNDCQDDLMHIEQHMAALSTSATSAEAPTEENLQFVRKQNERQETTAADEQKLTEKAAEKFKAEQKPQEAKRIQKPEDAATQIKDAEKAIAGTPPPTSAGAKPVDRPLETKAGEQPIKKTDADGQEGQEQHQQPGGGSQEEESKDQ